MNSMRWSWCSGCGKWEDMAIDKYIHYSMYCALEEPNERNFQGTHEELARFIVARQLAKEDQAKANDSFENRIDERMKRMTTVQIRECQSDHGPSERARHIAARIWCDPEMKAICMDVDAATEIAAIIDRLIGGEA